MKTFEPRLHSLVRDTEYGSPAMVISGAGSLASRISPRTEAQGPCCSSKLYHTGRDENEHYDKAYVPFNAPSTSSEYSQESPTKSLGSLLDRISASPAVQQLLSNPQESHSTLQDKADEFLSTMILPMTTRAAPQSASDTSVRGGHDEIRKAHSFSSQQAVPVSISDSGAMEVDEQTKVASAQNDLPQSPNSERSVDNILNITDSDVFMDDEATSVLSNKASPLIFTESFLEQGKQLLTPLIVQNLYRREKDHTADSVLQFDSDDVAQRVSSLVNDLSCVDFMEKAKKVKEQMDRLRITADNARSVAALWHKTQMAARKNSASRAQPPPEYPLGDLNLSLPKAEPPVVSTNAPAPSGIASVDPQVRNVESSPVLHPKMESTQDGPTMPVQGSGGPVPPTTSQASVDQEPNDVHQDDSNAMTTVSEGSVSVLPIPGLWLSRTGLAEPAVLEATFTVNPGLLSTADANDPARTHISLQLKCFPIAHIASHRDSLETGTSSQAVIDAVSTMNTEWPPVGKLVVDINAGGSPGRSWLPGETSGSIDLSESVRVGDNTMRFIQLADLSGFIFILYASHCGRSISRSVDPRLEEEATLAHFFEGFKKDTAHPCRDSSLVFRFESVQAVSEVM